METVSAKKQSKHVQQTSEEDSDGGGENGSEDGQSDSSNEKPVKVRFIFSSLLSDS